MTDTQEYCGICHKLIYMSDDGTLKHANQDGEKAAIKDGHEAEGPEEDIEAS